MARTRGWRVGAAPGRGSAFPSGTTLRCSSGPGPGGWQCRRGDAFFVGPKLGEGHHFPLSSLQHSEQTHQPRANWLSRRPEAGWWRGRETTLWSPQLLGGTPGSRCRSRAGLAASHSAPRPQGRSAGPLSWALKPQGLSDPVRHPQNRLKCGHPIVRVPREPTSVHIRNQTGDFKKQIRAVNHFASQALSEGSRQTLVEILLEKVVLHCPETALGPWRQEGDRQGNSQSI